MSLKNSNDLDLDELFFLSEIVRSPNDLSLAKSFFLKEAKNLDDRSLVS